MLESFKHYGIFLVIAIIIGSVLLSNRAGVNLTHHHNLPQLVHKNKIFCSGVVFKQCSVRLTTAIKRQEDYQEILQLLSDASSRDTITFFLSGGGGRGDSMIALINGIKETKAHTVAVVQGDVQSAHAALAISMNELKVGDFLFFMFHRGSLYGQENKICDKYKGAQDRKQDMEAKCRAVLALTNKIDTDITDKLYSKFLTKEEQQRVNEGHDVLISGEEMKKRAEAK